MKQTTRFKRGYTLVEMLTVVGIVAILAAIAVTGIIAVRNALEFRRLNDTAKAVYMAAQSNLVEMRASGEIAALKEDASSNVPASGAYHVSSDSSMNAGFEGWLAEYFYTSSRFPGAMESGSAYSLILPVNSIEGTVRDKNILIEYNPKSASVYSVFYTEREDLSLADEAGRYAVERGEAWRKSNKVGYYNGSSQGSASGDIYTDEEVYASVELVNEIYENGRKISEDAAIVVSVPIPSAYLMNSGVFMRNINASAVVTGEQFGGSFVLPESAFQTKRYSFDGKSIELIATIDSLRNLESFAGLAENNVRENRARGISEIAAEDDMKIKPGENVVVEAIFSYDTSEGDFFAAPASVSSEPANPLFSSMEVTTDGRYIIHISNGRNLQNLNQVAPSIGEKVYQVVLDSDIYWNETVSLYENVTSAAAEVPGRCLPYFVPITSESMFGSAVFHADTSAFLTMTNVPAMDDYKDVNAKNHAVVEGNGHRICYIDVNSGYEAMRYVGSSGVLESALGKPYYAGVTPTSTKTDSRIKNVGQPDAFSGLFSYVNTTIQNLNVVNPTVRGAMLQRWDVSEPGLSFPAAGSLVGAMGWNSYLTNCGAYIDPTDRYFNRANLKNYGVVGYGAVGGLVGYSKSHRTLEDGELDVRAEHLAFNRCFASVNVDGTMYNAEDTNRYILGYVEGVGGLVGISVLSNYYDCYSSSTVTGRNFYFQMLVNVARARGVGGFIGTCRGTRMTNCYATGDVIAYKLLSGGFADQSSNLGAAPFVGVIYNGESYSYTDSAFRDFIKDLFGRTTYQFSRFVNCYALGSVKQMNKNGGDVTYLSGFAGLYVKGENGIRDSLPKDGSVLFSSKDDDKELDGRRTTKYPNTYLYRDVYYLESWGKVKDWTNTGTLIGTGKAWFYDIGAGIPYQDFINLADKQSTFNEWKNLSAAQTHSYDHTGAYPFSVPSSQNSYYGTWPAPKLNAYIGYYEIYNDDTVGVYAFGEEYSTLKKDAKIKSDGYCILTSSRNNEITVRVDSKSYTVKPETNRVSIRNNEYVVYRLTKEIEKAVLESKNDTGTAAQKFYSHVEVVVPGETPYHLYYNPIFAKTNFISAKENTQAMTAADWSTVELPSSISIRTARQLYELGCSQTEKGIGAKYWGEGYNFVQELDIDTASYSWKDVYYSGKTNETDQNGPAFNPIGAHDTPFCGSYNGGLGYVEKAKIQNVTVKARADGNYGIFGVVGKVGTLNSMEAAEAADAEAAEETGARAAEPAFSRVENLTLVGKTLNLNGTIKNAALLCGVNNGILKNIMVTGNTTMNGSGITNAGLIVGSNAGILTGVSVNADAAALDGTNVGAVAGANSGRISAEVNLTTFTGKTFTNDGAVGGVVGNQTAGTLTGDFKIDNVVGQVNDASFSSTVGGIFGNFSGTLREGSTKIKTVKSQYGTAAGLAGKVKDGQISRYSLSVEEVSGGKGAAGGFGNVEKLTAENVQVQIEKSVKAASGGAAGFALTIHDNNSLLEQCSVELKGTITADQDNAAGFVIVGAGNMVDSNVFLGASKSAAVKIQAANGKAAGFAGELSGRADNCGVSGVGSIEGTDAAGFAALVSGEANACFATPASLRTNSKRTAYLNASADDLKITAANRAAGFAVEIGGSNIGSYALGTVKGETAAGYVVENSGSIRRGMANVTLASAGSGFVDTNKGAVDAAYVWYDGSVENGFVSENAGKINGCYAAALNEEAENLFTAEGSGFTDCYAVTEEEAEASEIEGVTNVTVDFMNEVDVADLDRNTTGTNWQRTGIKQYPYSSSLSFKSYMLPSLFNMSHYGDWVDTYGGGNVAYGMLYYEVDNHDNYYVGTVKVIDKGMWPDNAQERAERDLQKLDQMGDQGVSYGYALFTDDPSAFEGDADFVDFKNPLTKLSNTFFANYGVSCYPVTLDQRARNVTQPEVVRLFGVFFNPYFSDAIWDANGGSAPNPYRIRFDQQLENVGAFSNKNFKLEYDVDYSGLQRIDTFSGTLNGNGKAVYNLGVSLIGSMDGGNISQLNMSGDTSHRLIDVVNAGTVSGVTVDGNLGEGFVGRVGGTVTGITVNGSVFKRFAGDVDGTLDKVTVNGSVSEGFAGNVDGTLSRITINGDVNSGNTDNASMLGTVSGTVDALKVTGELSIRLAESVGTSGKLTELKVETFSGDRSMFGTVSGKIGSVYEEGVSENKSGLIVGTASQSIANTVGKDAVIANVGVSTYSNSKGLFGTVNGKLNNVNVYEEAKLTRTVSKASANVGIIADAVNEGAEISKVSIESAEMTLTNSPNDATVELNYGAVAGLVSGAKINDVQVSDLVMTISGSKNGGSITMSVGGLVGKAVKSGNTASVIYNSCVSFKKLNGNVTIGIERNNDAAGSTFFGGAIGTNQAIAANLTVNDLNLVKTGYDYNWYEVTTQRAVMQLSVGGLVGVMGDDAGLYGSRAGAEGSAIKFSVRGVGNRKNSKKPNYYLGGAVGLDMNNTNHAHYGRMDDATLSQFTYYDETYTNAATYAVSDITFTNENSEEKVYQGQFIGKIANGVFDACEGWGNTNYGFAGELKPVSSNPLKGVLVSDNPEAPKSGWQKYGSDYQLKDVNVEKYEADISRCAYKDADGAKHRLDIAGQYVYDLETRDYSFTSYNLSKMNGSDTPTENASYMLAAFSGGRGYALANDRSTVSTFAMDSSVTEGMTSLTVHEFAAGKSVVWHPISKKPFANLEIKKDSLSFTTKGESNKFDKANNKYILRGPTVALTRNIMSVRFINNQFTGRNGSYSNETNAQFFLYKVTSSEMTNKTWFTYGRNNNVIIESLMDSTLDADFAYGKTTTLEAIIVETEGLPDIVKEYPIVNTDPTFGNEKPSMSTSAEELEPEETVPETSEPEETVPETTEPEETVPETTEPEETVPETTEPEETTPEATVPEETVPETTASSESKPTEPTSPPETNPVSEAAEPPKSPVQDTLPENEE